MRPGTPVKHEQLVRERVARPGEEDAARLSTARVHSKTTSKQ